MSIKIKENTQVETADFWYDLMEGGYVKPESLCEDQKDADRIREAMNILTEFKDSLEDADAIEYL